jgi:hypothetical protein
VKKLSIDVIFSNPLGKPGIRSTKKNMYPFNQMVMGKDRSLAVSHGGENVDHAAVDGIAIPLNDGGRHQLHADQSPEGDRITQRVCESTLAGAGGKSIMTELERAD